ncbi:MAG: tetratricopeptide repeat protein [Phycisphaeraceae bacterium]
MNSSRLRRTLVARRSRLFAGALVLGLTAAGVAGCASSPVADYDAGYHDPAFDQGIDQSPTPRTLYLMARILATQGRDQQSEYVLTRLIDEHPNYLPAYGDLAELMMRQGRFDEAVETLWSALAIAPDDPVILNNLGMSHLLREEPGDALELFEQASAQAPSDGRYRANVATAMAAMGEYDQALEVYEQVLATAEAHYNLGVMSESRGDYTRAEQAYRHAGQLDRKLPVAPALERVARLQRHPPNDAPTDPLIEELAGSARVDPTVQPE